MKLWWSLTAYSARRTTWWSILPPSDDAFVKAFPAATTEAFCEGHNAAFRYFGGVPRRHPLRQHDLGAGEDSGRRQAPSGPGCSVNCSRTILFSDRLGRPGKGNDKGKVEGLVGYARRNFMVPAPRFPSWEAFNEQLEAQCLNNRKRRLRRHTETIEERFKRDRQALLPLPPTPYDACDKRTTRVTSLSLVRYRANDYSVPTRYGHRQVLLEGYVDEIVICCGSEEIARHRRSYEREELIFDPLHYLALLERKTNAPPRAWIRGASCNNSASWNCSTVNSGPTERRSKAAKFPVTKRSGHFRLPVLAGVEQEAGAGTGAL